MSKTDDIVELVTSSWFRSCLSLLSLLLGLAFYHRRIWCRPYHFFLSSCITTTFIRFAAPPFSLPLFLPVSPSLSWIVLRSLTFCFLRVSFFASQPTVSTSALRVNCFSLIFFVRPADRPSSKRPRLSGPTSNELEPKFVGLRSAQGRLCSFIMSVY
jgi:hypothetical protein